MIFFIIEITEGILLAILFTYQLLKYLLWGMTS